MLSEFALCGQLIHYRIHVQCIYKHRISYRIIFSLSTQSADVITTSSLSPKLTKLIFAKVLILRNLGCYIFGICFLTAPISHSYGFLIPCFKFWEILAASQNPGCYSTNIFLKYVLEIGRGLSHCSQQKNKVDILFTIPILRIIRTHLGNDTNTRFY